eukprot:3935407-Rhodomonas_salina.3
MTKTESKVKSETDEVYRVASRRWCFAVSSFSASIRYSAIPLNMNFINLKTAIEVDQPGNKLEGYPFEEHQYQVAGTFHSDLLQQHTSVDVDVDSTGNEPVYSYEAHENRDDDPENQKRENVGRSSELDLRNGRASGDGIEIEDDEGLFGRGFVGESLTFAWFTLHSPPLRQNRAVRGNFKHPRSVHHTLTRCQVHKTSSSQCKCFGRQIPGSGPRHPQTGFPSPAAPTPALNTRTSVPNSTTNFEESRGIIIERLRRKPVGSGLLFDCFNVRLAALSSRPSSVRAYSSRCPEYVTASAGNGAIVRWLSKYGQCVGRSGVNASKDSGTSIPSDKTLRRSRERTR